ncbi:response regulator [Janthinobacterium sp. 17J80-10]|uniref:response regulator transcription factor n=1 Tax=Janthinobacterium sp. 17J80-10 TaxID=2497863 RepID=UPI0010052C73|nr:response regulator [Janthinobacterium sp. 17J80-10]QAU35051.1 response regulator transcription factor [Janthinobacterium sp. 17J80-10]
MTILDDVQYTIYVVDDDDAFRESLVWLLESHAYQTQAFASAEDFLGICDQVLFGCLLVDMRMPGASGLELHDRLSSGGIQIPTIVMSGHGDLDMAVSAFRKGVVDFLQKPLDDRYLLSRIDHCIATEKENKRRLQSHENVARRLASLTLREKEVFDCILQGMLNKQIADRLGISIKTVEVHRSHVMKKIDATSVMELVKFSLAAGGK